jgi:predicted acyl esterase
VTDTTTIVSAEGLPHATTVREEWITLSDGCRLFCRVVLPVDASEHPVPAVLEYVPYRLSDGTAYGDATIHPYFAGHGYAAVRVDLRGAGNSDGILLDEYLPQEQLDGCEVIAWLAEQPWCDGSVGMFGKSWGGFNGLQIASHRPPALRAVVSAYFTDDRYADDVHYMGGCVLGHTALTWASMMLGFNALPPDPTIVGERWRAMWLKRLRDTPFFLEEWLRHQRRDEFWQQGSVCEDFGALATPTLLVGGWADAYTNAVDRTLAGLTAAGVPCRALLGPWSHGWPHVCEPGPRIGFLQECLRWWDHWLKAQDNEAMDTPLLRVYLQDYDPPAPRQAHRRGRWLAISSWPPSEPATPLSLWPQTGGGLGTAPPAAAAETVSGSERSGADCGTWCPYGDPTDFPPDQRAEDGLGLSYTTEPLTEALELLGAPEARLAVLVDRPLALLAVRLCDVSPDGSSLLVARGLLNLTHRDSHSAIAPMPIGEPVTVRLTLGLSGHVFAGGHRLRLSISPTYWPFAWPSPEPVLLTLRLGAETVVDLPRLPAAAMDIRADSFARPEQTAPGPGGAFHDSWRTSHWEAGTRTAFLEVGSEGRTHLDAADLDTSQRIVRTYSLPAGDPLAARVEHDAVYRMRREGWEITVTARTSMTSTATNFVIARELDAFEGNARVHASRTVAEIPRDGV